MSAAAREIPPRYTAESCAAQHACAARILVQARARKPPECRKEAGRGWRPAIAAAAHNEGAPHLHGSRAGRLDVRGDIAGRRAALLLAAAAGQALQQVVHGLALVGTACGPTGAPAVSRPLPQQQRRDRGRRQAASRRDAGARRGARAGMRTPQPGAARLLRPPNPPSRRGRARAGDHSRLGRPDQPYQAAYLPRATSHHKRRPPEHAGPRPGCISRQHGAASAHSTARGGGGPGSAGTRLACRP